jgi:hypothetical protein
MEGVWVLPIQSELRDPGREGLDGADGPERQGPNRVRTPSSNASTSTAPRSSDSACNTPRTHAGCSQPVRRAPRSQGGRQSDELSCAWRNPGSVLARSVRGRRTRARLAGRSSEQGPHSAVAIPTWSTPRHGPCFLISSVLSRPLIVSARELSNDEPTASTEGRRPAAARRSEGRPS